MIMNRMERVFRQQGFTLVELMIAMVLGLLLMGGVIQMHTANRQTYRVSEGVSRVQENARYAMAMIQREVRMAGYFGCNSETDLEDILKPNTLFMTDFDTPIEGFEATSATAWTPAIAAANLTLGTGSTDQVLGGSDLLAIRRAGDTTMPVRNVPAATSADLKTTQNLSPPPLVPGDIIVVADCVKSTMVQVMGYTQANGNVVHNTGASVSPSNFRNPLSTHGPYGSDAEIMKYQSTVFFVGNDANGETSLHRKVNLQNSEVLVNGVENMQVLYGVDTDGDKVANRYVGADNINAVNTVTPVIPDWTNVVSVRVSLLLQSPDNATDQADNDDYNLLGETISTAGGVYAHPVDRKLRYVVSSTIQLRNRGL